MSIHRTKSFRHLEDEDSYDSTVDSKLALLSNEFVRFFSSLSQQASQELTKFQESVFLSMLMTKGMSSIRKIDLESEKKALLEIFDELNVEKEQYKDKFDKHFKTLEIALKKLKGQKAKISSEEIAALFTNPRVDYVVREWGKLRSKKAEIYEPVKTFLDLINNLVYNKQFCINTKNELIANLPNSSSLALSRLSSGEKQMVIILGEALLQHQSPSIYIADEPELSLHVEWQQSLIDNIRSINPSAQIIFATHSPDIVGNYSSGVIDVEELIR